MSRSDSAKNREHARQRPATRRCHIERFGERYKPDADGVKLVQGGNEIQKRPPPAIQTPNHDGVQLAP
jgi:hypothetical protein